MKKIAFTLSEVLITLSIIGVVSVLVLPNLTADVYKKSNIAKLQSTLAALNDAVKNSMIEERVRNLEDSTIVTNPEQFLKTYLKITKICGKDKETECGFASSYNSIDGSLNILIGKMIGSDKYSIYSAILPSGVSVKLIDSFNYDFIVDVNGPAKPNVIGRDMFLLVVQDDFTVGGIGYATHTDSSYLEKCKNGSNYGAPCVDLLQRANWKMEY